ncbi:MAG: hypothetical protein KGL35_17420 [Bradyrhizobium sp.]|nr:hypothetical protein [Bradyrhizobium sp.]
MSRYLLNLLVALDRLLNTIGLGDPRMTLSARMGRDIAQGKCWLCRPVCWVLGLIQRDHCAQAWASEQVPVDASQQLAKE